MRVQTRNLAAREEKLEAGNRHEKCRCGNVSMIHNMKTAVGLRKGSQHVSHCATY